MKNKMSALLLMVIFLLIQTGLHEARLSLGYPTVIEEQLGHNVSMTFTFETQTNQSNFVFSIKHVQDNNKLVLQYDNEQETANVWSTRGQTNIVGDQVDWTVVVTLSYVMVTDEGRYIIKVSESEQMETGELYIVTFAQPISLQMEITGEIKDGQEINIRCHGNVGRPNPELRLLQTNPVFNVTTILDSYSLPDNMTTANGTYDLDFTFKRRLGDNDVNTTIKCYVLHNIWLGKELRPITSNSNTLNFELNPANAADASIQAPDKIILGTTTLDITCSVTSATSLKRIYSLTLLRNNSNTASVLTVIGFIDSDVDGATIKNDANLQSRASIAGTVASPSTAQLKLSVSASSTKCTDAVSYQCKVVALTTGDNTDTYLKDKDIKVEVRPSSTADIVVHSGSSSISDSKPYKYTPGTVVTLTCKGSVGNPAKLHRWCKKGVNDQRFTGYSYSAHINQEVSLVYQPATCDYQRTSSLTYNITTQDTKIEFLCEDGTNSLCGDGLFTKQVVIENTNAADASIQAPDKIILGTTTLDITCSATSATSLKRIYSLTLLRNNSNAASVLTVIGFIDSDIDGATIKNDANLQNRASISGTVASPSTAQLKLSVPASSTKCTDAVSYQCKVIVLNTGDNTETYLKDKDIKVEGPQVKDVN